MVVHEVRVQGYTTTETTSREVAERCVDFYRKMGFRAERISRVIIEQKERP